MFCEALAPLLKTLERKYVRAGTSIFPVETEREGVLFVSASGASAIDKNVRKAPLDGGLAILRKIGRVGGGGKKLIGS